MAIDVSPEQREIGKANFHRVVGQRYELNRRDFMRGALAATAVVPVTAALYYGYQKLDGSPVKVGLIGAGDEGGVLVGEHNPAYLEFVAYSDIRPSNQKRIFEGEPTGPRKGFNRIYGNDAEENQTARELQGLAGRQGDSRPSSSPCRCTCTRRSPSRPCGPASTSSAKSSWPGTSASARR